MSKQHYINRNIAIKKLKELSEIKTPGSQFYFLRNLDVFVFEEMILLALKKKGYKIIYNKAYTGDGGIDGRAYLNDQHYLIQAKRYTNHINPRDVEEFITLCKRRKGKGLFVHTGKTGGKSWDMARGTDIDIISGERLLEFFLKAVPQAKYGLFSQLVNSLFRQK